MQPRQHPPLTAIEQQRWQRLIQNRCGLHFSDGRLYLLQQRIWERVQLLALGSYEAYYALLQQRGDSDSEWLALQDSLLNNASYFLRHSGSFAALRQRALPQLLAESDAERPLQLWSAGCAAGQEAYSLALVALEVLAGLGRQLHVIGSDISRQRLARARRGRYREHEVRHMPPAFRQSCFRRSVVDGRPLYEVRDAVRSVVQFGFHNLHRPDDGATAAIAPVEQDVIFCQNVLIYFEAADRASVVARLAQRLRPGGFLFLAPAELIGAQTPATLRQLPWPDVLVFQRRPAAKTTKVFHGTRL